MNFGLNKFFLLEKIPPNPFPQYSNPLFSTVTENDISLFSISILFSKKKLIKFGYVCLLKTINPISIGISLLGL